MHPAGSTLKLPLQNQGAAWLIVYLGELLAEPSPTMESPWLIWLPAGQIVETARRDVPLCQLLADGAQLLTGPDAPPPEVALTRLTDSQEALVLALGDCALGVYESW